MIKRKVFIVRGHSNSVEERQIDEYYSKAYSTFFNLAAGGAYFKEEVIYLSEPSSMELNQKVNEETLDFGIIVYIGHGANQEENQIFQLNSLEIIKPGQFILNSKKQIIILESCRVLLHDIPTVDLFDKIPRFENGGIVRLALTIEQSREIYDSHIKRCESGLMICYACTLGEEAYNYIFSHVLLQHAMDWHLDSSRHCAILPADELTRLCLMDTVAIAKRKFGVQQFPFTENSTNFPIGVSKF